MIWFYFFFLFFLCFVFRNSFIDILRAILLSLEVLIEDQELQINGFILIIDWSNFSFKQASKLTPSILKLAIEGLQVGGGHCVPTFFVTAARGTCPSTGQGTEAVGDSNPKCLYPIHLQHRLIFRCFIFTVFCFFFFFLSSCKSL